MIEDQLDSCDPGPMVAVPVVLRVLVLWRKMTDLFLSPYQVARYGRPDSQTLPQFCLLWYMLNHIVIHLSVVASENKWERHSCG